MLLGLLAPTVGAAVRSMLVAAMFWRMTSSSNSSASRFSCRTPSPGGGEMKEEMAITVYWVPNEIDHCHIGFLPCAFVVQGSLWDGVLCQVVEVFGKDDPCKLCHAKWHQNKGFAHVAVIGTLQVPFGAGNFPGKKDKGVKGLGKKEG
jgi:hypothetical protein